MVDLVKTAENNKAEEPKAPIEKGPESGLNLKGIFNRYDSQFLKLMIPLLTTRYVFQAIEDINPKNVMIKPDPSKTLDGLHPRPGFEPWKKPPFGEYLRRNMNSIGMGLTMLGFIGYYSKSTANDIKEIYSEAVGYELDKKKEDVTWRDIFVNSKNEALNVTRNAFKGRTLARMAAGASFLMPWQIFRDFTVAKPKYDANLSAGVGILSSFLFLDSTIRKPSFFDHEQNMISKSINHEEVISNETISSQNIQTLMMVQQKHLNKSYKTPPFNSPEGKQQAVIATRIADLMNQTYNNVDRVENANFTIGKFNFLIGFHMLDSFPESLAYIELANKSTDMKDVKKVAALIKAGHDAQSAFLEYGVDMNAMVKIHTDLHSSPDAPQKKFTEMVPAPKEKQVLAQRTLKDFAAITETTTSPNL